MVINIQQLDYLQGTHILKAEYVFFEEAYQPSTSTGKGITEGCLVLTDNELAFFSMRKGRDSVAKRAGIEIAKHIAAHIANEFTFGLAGFGMALAEYGIEKGIAHRKDNDMDFNLSAQNDDSFAIALRRVVSCEKFGGRFSSSKKRYVRIGILNDYGIKGNYCIYSVNPKNIRQQIRYEEWFNIINKTR